MQTKGETSQPPHLHFSFSYLHSRTLQKNCLHPKEQEWQGQFSATNKSGNQNPNTPKRRFFKSDDDHHHDAKVHVLLFTKIYCTSASGARYVILHSTIG
jgi:hypothetical protein